MPTSDEQYFSTSRYIAQQNISSDDNYKLKYLVGNILDEKNQYKTQKRYAVILDNLIASGIEPQAAIALEDDFFKAADELAQALFFKKTTRETYSEETAAAHALRTERKTAEALKHMGLQKAKLEIFMVQLKKDLNDEIDIQFPNGRQR